MSMPAMVPSPLDNDQIRAVCLDAGADDVGFVSLDHPRLRGEGAHAVAAMPGARSLISLVVRVAPAAIRSPSRPLANDEFHHGTQRIAEISRRIVSRLAARGVEALAVPAGFPMDMSRIPGRIWTISHKLVAEAAGTGVMGLHRLVIHPRFGNNILLGTIILDRSFDHEGEPLADSPCLGCNLCVAVCPVGAIKVDGRFDFAACHNHNYLEFNGGFLNLLDTLAASRSARDLRSRMTDSEMVSWWQSLAFGPNYKAAYCMAVCPAGTDLLPRYGADKAGWKEHVLKPLTTKVEDVYVVPHSDAEDHLRRRFPHKRPRLIRSALRPTSIAGLLRSLPIAFNPGRAGDLAATFQFRFHGDETIEAAITIRDGNLVVADGLHERPDVTITADSRAWLGYVRGERRLLPAIVLGKVRLKGRNAASLMTRFAQCFPR